MKNYKIFIDSALWGCESNFINCAKIYQYLVANGHNISNDLSKADYIIISSCGVVKEAIDHSIQLYKRYYKIKKKDAKIIMFGCLVKIDNKLVKTLDSHNISFEDAFKLDNFFYNTQKFDSITPHCDKKTKDKLLNNREPFEFLSESVLIIPKTLAKINTKFKNNYTQILRKFTYYKKCFVEISRGCCSDCSYCVIKKAKGKLQSRRIDDIISDINKVYNSSKKLHLVSDDCGCYGLDIGTNLFELLYQINNKFSDISIELNNLNPIWLEKYPKKYIKLFKELNIGFIKIPIQSASNKIIKNMNRHYNVENVISIIDKIKVVSPKTFILNHFIVGFPGESTFDFLKSLKASKHFDFSYPFKYSKNKGTTSFSLTSQKSKFIISIRHTIFLINLNFNLTFKLLKQQVSNKNQIT